MNVREVVSHVIHHEIEGRIFTFTCENGSPFAHVQQALVSLISHFHNMAKAADDKAAQTPQVQGDQPQPAAPAAQPEGQP